MPNQFEKTKKDILTKLDKSSKGFIDEKIENLCNIINLNNNLISLSSCSGRICLLEVSKENNKKESNWLIITHEEAKLEDFWKEIESYKGKNKVEFKVEFPILHIQTNSIEKAQKLINTAKESGFNRCGIISSQRKIVVELICMMPYSIPIYDNKILIGKEYLEYLINFSNEKLSKSWNSINKYRFQVKDI